MNKKGIAALIIGASLLSGAGLIGFILLVKHSVERRDARRAEEQVRAEAELDRARAAEREAGRAEAAAVFADPTRPTPAEEGEFTEVFDALGGALERGDTHAVGRSFDGDRMVVELEQIRAFDRLPRNGAPGFKEGVRRGIEEKLGTMLVANELARWSRTEVRQVRWSADRKEVVVIAIHHNGDGDDVPLRFRWWLVRRGAGWRAYDFEDLHMGLRATRSVAALATPELIDRIARDPAAFQAAMAGIRDAMVLLAKGDVDGGDAALAPARAIVWPPPIRALVELAEGTIQLGRGDPAGALVRFEEAERLFPGMPCAALLRGSAYVALGRHDEAFAAVRAYQKEVGPDALSCTLEGTALEALGRRAEAAEAYRRALDEVAGSADAFNGLRRVLPDDQKKELGQRLARLKDPHRLYHELVGAARREGDTAGADALVDGLLAANPSDPRALGEDIRRKVTAGKFAEAAKVLARGLKSPDRGDAEAVLRSYLYAMLGADRALEAYAAAPAEHARRAFRTLADELEDDLSDQEEDAAPVKLKQLNELIAAHRKHAADDPWLWFFEGAIHQHARDYERAERAFAAGAAKLPPRKAAAPDDPDGDDEDEGTQFRTRRVECLFRLNKGLDAYRTIGPANDTFRQLAHLYDAGKDYTGLEKLIAAHRAGDANDPEATFWQARLLFRKGEYGRAVLIYDKYLQVSAENAPNRVSARDELIRSRLRVNPKGAAASVAELGPDQVNRALRAAVAAANGDRAELVRLLEESTRDGVKTWFYSDEDFRAAIYQPQYTDLRTKYPDPNPPKQDG
jgi:predicted negative regulator of RcsB-dependent stress response